MELCQAVYDISGPDKLPFTASETLCYSQHPSPQLPPEKGKGEHKVRPYRKITGFQLTFASARSPQP